MEDNSITINCIKRLQHFIRGSSEVTTVRDVEISRFAAVFLSKLHSDYFFTPATREKVNKNFSCKLLYQRDRK